MLNTVLILIGREFDDQTTAMWEQSLEQSGYQPFFVAKEWCDLSKASQIDRANVLYEALKGYASQRDAVFVDELTSEHDALHMNVVPLPKDVTELIKTLDQRYKVHTLRELRIFA